MTKRKVSQSSSNNNPLYNSTIAIIAIIIILILVINSNGTIERSNEAIAGEAIKFGKGLSIDTIRSSAKEVAGAKEKEEFSTRYRRAVSGDKSTTILKPVKIQNNYKDLYCIDGEKNSKVIGFKIDESSNAFQLNCLDGLSEVAGKKYLIQEATGIPYLADIQDIGDGFSANPGISFKCENSYNSKWVVNNEDSVKSFLIGTGDNKLEFVQATCQSGEKLKSTNNIGQGTVLSCGEGESIIGIRTETKIGNVVDIIQVFCAQDIELVYEPEYNIMEVMTSQDIETFCGPDFDLTGSGWYGNIEHTFRRGVGSSSVTDTEALVYTHARSESEQDCDEIGEVNVQYIACARESDTNLITHFKYLLEDEPTNKGYHNVVFDAEGIDIGESSSHCERTFVHHLKGLAPGTRYLYQWSTGEEKSEVGYFKTASVEKEDSFKFIMLADTQTMVDNSDGKKICGHLKTTDEQSFSNMGEAFLRLSQEYPTLDILFYPGDTAYKDQGSYNPEASSSCRTPAHEIGSSSRMEAHHEKFIEQQNFIGYRNFMRSTPTEAVWDDHEVKNNWDYEKDGVSCKDRYSGINSFIARFPFIPGSTNERGDKNIYDDDAAGCTSKSDYLKCCSTQNLEDTHEDMDKGTNTPADFIYRTINRPDVDIFLLDTRRFRGKKSYLGSNQKEWLKEGLDNSQEQKKAFKIIITTGPISRNIGSAGDDTWSYSDYNDERTEILNYIRENGITGVIFFAGDLHFSQVSNVLEPGTPDKSNSQGTKLENYLFSTIEQTYQHDLLEFQIGAFYRDAYYSGYRKLLEHLNTDDTRYYLHDPMVTHSSDHYKSDGIRNNPSYFIHTEYNLLDNDVGQLTINMCALIGPLYSIESKRDTNECETFTFKNKVD